METRYGHGGGACCTIFYFCVYLKMFQVKTKNNAPMDWQSKLWLETAVAAAGEKFQLCVTNANSHSSPGHWNITRWYVRGLIPGVATASKNRAHPGLIGWMKKTDTGHLLMRFQHSSDTENISKASESKNTEPTAVSHALQARSQASVWASCGCRDKPPPTQWFKTTQGS